jgi:signal transduction histidine kinase
MNLVIDKAVGLISSLIKKATDNFRVHYWENLPTLQGNSQRLGQVVINLVVNGCQALTAPTQTITITTGYLEESEEIYVEIRDTGIGMSPEVLSRIKDPFFTTRRNKSGTGLGLSISDTIVRNHGGWIDFRSVAGEGTTVTVLLPRYSNNEVTGRMV